MTEENWKSVVGYDGQYEVSDLGRVRSLDRQSACGRALKGRMMKLSKASHGYLNLVLCNGAKLTRLVHPLVLEAFVGPCPDGMEGCHNDGNRMNNRLSNLRWDTRRNNFADKHAHGTASVGERSHLAKFNAADIKRIFDLSSKGRSSQQIADCLGGCRENISQILRGKTWSHLGLSNRHALPSGAPPQ